VPGVFCSNEQKMRKSSWSTNEELIAQEKKLIRRHNEWEANKKVRATQVAPNTAYGWGCARILDYS
jgi:hypothetical protein